MLKELFFFILFLGLSECLNGPWAWRCLGEGEKSECIREKAQSGVSNQTSLEKCKLTCGPYATLVPKPKRLLLGKDTVSFVPSSLSHLADCAPAVCSLLNEAVAILNGTLDMYYPEFKKSGASWSGPFPPEVESHRVLLKIRVPGTEEYLTLETDESYKINITTTDSVTTVLIFAATFFGARNALETVSQLIDYDPDHQSLQILTQALVDDAPYYPYRGISLDTSRNYISVEQIKKMLRGMAYSKLNTFHWHITDTHSFPLVLSSLPNMSLYGAYSPEETYTGADVKDILHFARVRGIRVVPEIDSPAHVGHGWEWAEETSIGKLVLCLGWQPWKVYCLQPPCGQMNLANSKLYDVLGTLYNELVDMFKPLPMFHFGGDEISLHCWNSSMEMTEWMTAQGYGLDADSYYEQWGVFHEKARLLLTEANKGVEVPSVVWTSHLTEDGRAQKFLDKTKYIIQIWSEKDKPMIGELLQSGHRVIFSNKDAFYFDCGVSSYVGKGKNSCSPYKGWQDVYDNDLEEIAFNRTNSTLYNDQILGGEAAIWTEQIDDATLEARLWPRGSALAERLWTNPKTDYSRAEYRILQQRHRLFQRGLRSERLQPEWCRLYQGQCRTHLLPPPWPATEIATEEVPEEVPENVPENVPVKELV